VCPSSNISPTQKNPHIRSRKRSIVPRDDDEILHSRISSIYIVALKIEAVCVRVLQTNGDHSSVSYRSVFTLRP